MISGYSVLGIIPARGGSKGVARKNVRPIAGKPLIAWTIQQAKESPYIDRLIVSSEDSEVIQVAIRWGCEAPFVRPAELAADETPMIDVVLHALGQLEHHDYVILLQPTSPLRNSSDIDAALKLCVQQDAPVVVSVTQSAKHPAWMFELDQLARLKPIAPEMMHVSRRQELAPVYVLNGAVYVARWDWLVANRTFLPDDVRGYEMPALRSVDIDTEVDLLLCNLLMRTATNDGT